MSSHSSFTGSIPENYDKYLGGVFFEPFANDLVERVQVREGGKLLEIACGTGIVTNLLRDKLPTSVKIVATDLNDAMIAYARGKIGEKESLEWKQADGTVLPFENSSFDAVVCQFGLMFFPDKARAVREVKRVLAPGGIFLFNTWDSLEKNEVARIANQRICSIYPDDPPKFYQTPFSLHDKHELRRMLEDAGFRDIELTNLSAESVGSPAFETAIGLVQGNPVMMEINQRGTATVAEVTEAVGHDLAARFGTGPIKGKLHAIVCTARS